MAEDALRGIATKLVACCREGREGEGLDTLYAAEAVSVEAAAMGPDSGSETKGLEAIRAKHAWWDANIAVERFSADGPYLHGPDRFAVIFEAAFAMKSTGERTEMKEIGLYTVKRGKIVREEFFALA